MGDMIDGIKNVMINKLDIPREIIKNSYKIILDGNEFLTVENHRGIVKFDKDEIVLKVDDGFISILGNNFNIVYISGNTLKVNGFFMGVKYEQLWYIFNCKWKDEIESDY